jgi:hypothetical protein
MIKLFLLLLLNASLYAFSQPYVLQIKLDQNEIYLGEQVKLKLLFYYKDLEDYELTELKIKNIDVKELNSSDYKTSTGMSVEEINYQLTPQKKGFYSISNLEAHIEVLTKKYRNFDNRSKYTQKFSIHSNNVKLHVVKLPYNISVIGNYTLSAKVTEQEISAGIHIYYTITLRGSGNIENLDFFSLKLENASSFLIMSSINKKKDVLQKTFKIFAKRSYIIPVFKLEYFDKELDLVRTTQTKSFHILIPTIRKESLFNKKIYLFILLSILVLIILYGVYKRWLYQQNFFILSTEIKKAKNRDDLYKMIVVYLGKDRELDRLIYGLEKCSDVNFKKEKKTILKLIMKLDILTSINFSSNLT